jgi:hypothetical protein
MSNTALPARENWTSHALKLGVRQEIISVTNRLDELLDECFASSQKKKKKKKKKKRPQTNEGGQAWTDGDRPQHANKPRHLRSEWSDRNVERHRQGR